MRSSRLSGAVPVAVLCLLGSGCTTRRTIERGAPPPRGGWLVVTFPAPREVRATLADGATRELANVSAVRGRLVAAAGDTLTLRMDVPGSGIRVGSSPASLHSVEDVGRVTLVRDAGTDVRQHRVSLVRTAALALLAYYARDIIKGIEALGDCCAID